MFWNNTQPWKYLKYDFEQMIKSLNCCTFYSLRDEAETDTHMIWSDLLYTRSYIYLILIIRRPF